MLNAFLWTQVLWYKTIEAISQPGHLEAEADSSVWRGKNPQSINQFRRTRISLMLSYIATHFTAKLRFSISLYRFMVSLLWTRVVIFLHLALECTDFVQRKPPSDLQFLMLIASVSWFVMKCCHLHFWSTLHQPALSTSSPIIDFLHFSQCLSNCFIDIHIDI